MDIYQDGKRRNFFGAKVVDYEGKVRRKGERKDRVVLSVISKKFICAANNS